MGQLIPAANADRTEVSEPALLIRVNQLYRHDMTSDEIYEITRGVWRVGQRRHLVVLALAIFHGMVQGVFQVESWHPAGTTPYSTRTPREVEVSGRWEFVGRTATSKVANRYLGKSVAHYFKQGNRNPVTYANCPVK